MLPTMKSLFSFSAILLREENIVQLRNMQKVLLDNFTYIRNIYVKSLVIYIDLLRRVCVYNVYVRFGALDPLLDRLELVLDQGQLPGYLLGLGICILGLQSSHLQLRRQYVHALLVQLAPVLQYPTNPITHTSRVRTYYTLVLLSFLFSL